MLPPAKRYSVCTPIPDSVFVEPIHDTNNLADALEYAKDQRAHGIECRTYDWWQHPLQQILDGRAS